MLSIIIAGVLAFVLLMGADKILAYGRKNGLYIEGYLKD